jgi:hypothetical protein
MSFWVILIAYEAAWFITVFGAGHGRAWPGLLAVAIFATWRLRMSVRRPLELRLMALALGLGLLLDGGLAGTGLLVYAAAWPAGIAPAWILGLWLAFALTVVPLFGYLQKRPWLAAALGGICGPLSYLGAARGWRAVRFTPPAWHALLWLAIGWGIAVPLLVGLAGYSPRGTTGPLGQRAL